MGTQHAPTGVEFWILFHVLVLGLLALDLGVFNRRPRAMGTTEAFGWSIFWILLAGGFNILVLTWKGPVAAEEFLGGYLLEKSLSVDNLLVFVLIFAHFRLSRTHQRRVLSWGILGALILRGLFVGLGSVVLTRFHWVSYLFGAFLVYTGLRLPFQEDDDLDPDNNAFLRVARRILPVAKASENPEGAFLVKEDNRWKVTELFLVLLVVESSDIIFAVDSIPAVFAVTRDPFIVYTSNVFAILGLRALYFLLAHAVERFRYLKTGISIVLAFVGFKMLVADIWPISSSWTLAVVAGVLGVSTFASLLIPVEDNSNSPGIGGGGEE
jgi:tellurite resistance protein TerC